MAEDILKKIDQRRHIKKINPVQYKKLNSNIRPEIKTAKRHHLSRNCTEIEELEQKDHTFN